MQHIEPQETVGLTATRMPITEPACTGLEEALPTLQLGTTPSTPRDGAGCAKSVKSAPTYFEHMARHA